MAKDLIEDIKRPKRSLQDVLPASPSRGEAPARATPPKFSSDGGRPSSFEPPPARRRGSSSPRRRRWFLLFIIILIVVLLAGFFLSSSLGRATVTITPKQVPITVSGTFRAIRLPSANASSTALGFQLMTIKANESTTVPAGESKAVSLRATGSIIISNRYSKTPQPLIINTRFEAPNGKIYRIKKAVTIPGYIVAGSTITPGELEVEVTADQPGAEYNGTPATFTIPGFKGDPRFNTITARAKTAFTGGFVGEKKVISPETLATAQNKLDGILKDRLLAEASGQILDGFVWYPKSVFWLADNASSTDTSTANEAIISRQVELVAPILSQAELSQALARRALPSYASYDGGMVLLDNLSNLDLQLVGPMTDPKKSEDFVFSLAGQGNLIWQFDKMALLKDLSGRSKDDYGSVFVKYPSIISATATFNPPWLLSFPTDPKRITIETNLTEDQASAKMSDTTNQRDIINGN